MCLLIYMHESEPTKKRTNLMVQIVLFTNNNSSLIFVEKYH